ncbi:hypothetical protein NIES3585_31790 [Nodularia sp. NIES-3585]|nr:hypothetical protein NIES3585_31790 [Nodularia sp. NIES-3585]
MTGKCLDTGDFNDNATHTRTATTANQSKFCKQILRKPQILRKEQI